MRPGPAENPVCKTVADCALIVQYLNHTEGLPPQTKGTTMSAQLEVKNLVAGMSHYGHPLAQFDSVVLRIGGRDVYVDAIYWDSEYAAYFASGHYARKDGSRGNQIAKPVMGANEMPKAVLDALSALK